MSNTLNAEIFEDSFQIYHDEFERILIATQECYKLLLSENIKVQNDENQITKIICKNYLENDAIRAHLNISDFYFILEAQEGEYGRTDIRVITQNTFSATAAYYIIECKRLDSQNLRGKSGLNAKYIENGISRFMTPSYYSSYHKLNGMLGFIVEKINIDENIKNLNFIAKKFFAINMTYEISFHRHNIYQSKHLRSDSVEITLYHLMLDFSESIA